MPNMSYLGPACRSTSELPFYSARVPAGFPSPADDHLEQKISLDTLLKIDAPHTFLVRTSGDSMIDAGIFDEDLLIVSRALPAADGDIVIAAINGEIFVKRLSRTGKQIALLPENANYLPRYILESDELVIWGVVTASIRRHHGHA